MMQWIRAARKIRTGLALSGALFAVSASAAEIAITNTGPLSFGSFVAGAGGSVSVTTSGARTATGAVVLIPSSTGAAAGFSLSGDAGAIYLISLPGDGAVLLDNGAGQSMELSGFISNPSDFGQLGAGGTQALSIGATLNVGASQAPGAYSGTFSVTVEYQ